MIDSNCSLSIHLCIVLGVGFAFGLCWCRLRIILRPLCSLQGGLGPVADVAPCRSDADRGGTATEGVCPPRTYGVFFCCVFFSQQNFLISGQEASKKDDQKFKNNSHKYPFAHAFIRSYDSITAPGSRLLCCCYAVNRTEYAIYDPGRALSARRVLSVLA